MTKSHDATDMNGWKDNIEEEKEGKCGGSRDRWGAYGKHTKHFEMMKTCQNNNKKTKTRMLKT